MVEKAQKGDLIRVVDPVDHTSTFYKAGDIFEVSRRNSVDTGVYLTVDWPAVPFSALLHDSEYVIHRKAGEEDEPKTVRRGAPDAQFTAFIPPREIILSADQARALAGETQADRIKRAGTELTDLLVRKNHDYGDSFAKQYEKYGLMSALIRMDDKMRRLETLLDGTDAQVDESIKDTLLDLAGYALLASVEAGKR